MQDVMNLLDIKEHDLITQPNRKFRGTDIATKVHPTTIHIQKEAGKKWHQQDA